MQKNKFNKSKLSLIGTVQPFATNVASCGWKIVSFQSLIGTVQPQKELVNKQKELVQSLIGTVQHFQDEDGLWYAYRFQSLIGTVQRSDFWNHYQFWKNVSISHRYSVTTVFTAFSVFIIPHFPCFSTFFSKKVGQPLHCRFSQSLDFTVLEVHRLFYRIFNNLLFECPTLNFYRKPKI